MLSHVPLSGDTRIAQAKFLTSFHSFLASLQRDFPFDFLFLSDWMECFFDLVSIKVKLSGNCIIVTFPFMLPSLNGFDESRIAVDYSHLNFP